MNNKADTQKTIQISLKGKELLGDALLNKDTAFTDKERRELDLEGLLPPHIESLDEQVRRCYAAYQQKDRDIERHIYLRALQDRNENLFYKLILEHLKEMMPIIYTPVVGEACKQFSNIYRKSRGLFISYPNKDHIEKILDNIGDRDIRVIVVTDGERILGLGDQGAGGMGIPIGKLSLYTACGGIDPSYTLPITLDVGTNSEELRNDPTYIGWRHERITGQDYFDFVDAFITALKKKFPNVLLQFEDFAIQHATPLLEKYRDKLCTFNDDVQGTASVALGAALAAVRSIGQKLSDQRIAVLGGGSAGCGISSQLKAAMVAEGLSEEEARKRFYLVDRYGLLHTGSEGLMEFQKPFVRDKAELAKWQGDLNKGFMLKDVVKNAKPTMLIGVCGQPDQFTQDIVEEMMTYLQRPIIFPMSNPTSRCEALPKDLIEWTDGKALIATGSPFEPVHYKGEYYGIAQSNNVYIFPGMGLGVLASGAKRVTDEMFIAAANALADDSPAIDNPGGALLPELENIREVGLKIAFATAKMAMQQGHADKCSDEELMQKINGTVWEPEYCHMTLKK